MVRRLGLTVFLAGCSASPGVGEATDGADATDATDATDASSAASAGTATSTADSGSTTAPDASSSGEQPEVTGELLLLSYNVAGLPVQVSDVTPDVDNPKISPLLNAYPLALVQEDFFYHEGLTAEIEHPFVSEPFPADPMRMGMGDGLNRFSQTPFTDHERQQWYDCNGTLDCSSDCLARKGWSFARHTVADGVEIDIYNLHMEAGGCIEDLEIRLQATLDLADAIAERSAGRAIVVAGDFNLRESDPEDVQPLINCVEGAGLTDTCMGIPDCDDHIDHIMIRDGETVTLEAMQWWVAEEFVDERTGLPLSDPPAIAARLAFRG